MIRRHGLRQREQRSGRHHPRHGGYRSFRHRGAGRPVGGRIRGRLLRGAARRPGRDPPPPHRHRARHGRGHPGSSRGRRAAAVRHQPRRRARPRARRDRRRSCPRDRARHGGARHRRPGRGQRRHGRAQGVPPRQRPQPDQPQRALHGHHREHDGRRIGRHGRAALHHDPIERRRDPHRASPDLARHEDRNGLRQARAEGAVRSTRPGGSRRPPTPSQAPEELARGARTDVRKAGPDPFDTSGPHADRSSSRSSRHCRTTFRP